MSRVLAHHWVGAPSAEQQARRNRSEWWLTYSAALTLGLATALVAYKRSSQVYLGIALTIWLLLLVAWVKFPRLALAVTVGLTLVGDLVTVSWFPFNKNLSSLESIAFLADGISLSPYEITLAWALAVTAYRNLASIGRPFRSAPLVRPFAVLLVFVAIGFGLGLSRGGDSRAALYELRPLLYLPLAYLLVVNVCRSRADYRRVFGAAIVAIVVQSLLSLDYLLDLAPDARADLDSLNEHGSAIGMNLVITTTVLSLMYRNVSWRVRLPLLLSCIPVVWVYLIAQRRAAFVALGVAFILVAIILFMRQRRTFWKIVPIAAILTIGYTGAFWNSQSSAGFPAQAIKTVVAPDSLSAEDQSSDLYRDVENYNLNATIRSAPVTGLGFGQPFLRPIALPDISVFEFNAYFPHNSLLWVWVKTGFFGFAALLYILARTVMLGAARIRRTPMGIDLVIATNAVLFAVMYIVYLFVDVGWETRNVTLFALSMALCTAPLVDEDEPSEVPTPETPPQPTASDPGHSQLVTIPPLVTSPHGAS